MSNSLLHFRQHSANLSLEIVQQVANENMNILAPCVTQLKPLKNNINDTAVSCQDAKSSTQDDNKTPTLDNKTPTLDNKTSTLDNKMPTLDNKTSTLDDKSVDNPDVGLIGKIKSHVALLKRCCLTSEEFARALASMDCINTLLALIETMSSSLCLRIMAMKFLKVILSAVDWQESSLDLQAVSLMEIFPCVQYIINL